MSPHDSSEADASLHPVQVCFVVNDVSRAATDCAERFGWGPFQRIAADLPRASYRDWSGRKRTDVALGMAGRVQVELIHVHEGQDAVATYQARYGAGFQHLGISCRSREGALTHLEALGARVDELNEFDGVRIAFVDVPTGPAMFELLQPMRDDAAGGATKQHEAPRTRQDDVFALDRATIVAADMQRALAFYSRAFGWEGAEAKLETLRHPGGEQVCSRYIGRAGALRLELVSPRERGDDPYSRHLERGDHGLVHAGGRAVAPQTLSGDAEYEWLEVGERFSLLDWEGGARGLQVLDLAC